MTLWNFSYFRSSKVVSGLIRIFFLGSGWPSPIQILTQINSTLQQNNALNNQKTIISRFYSRLRLIITRFLSDNWLGDTFGVNSAGHLKKYYSGSLLEVTDKHFLNIFEILTDSTFGSYAFFEQLFRKFVSKYNSTQNFILSQAYFVPQS